MSGTEWALVAGGGAVGACGRFALDLWLRHRLHSRWPWSTLVVNVLGCAGLGLVRGLEPASWWVALLATGVFGAFTTASTFAWEVLLLVRRRRGWAATAYVLSSVVIGYLALLGAHALAASAATHG